MRRLTKRQVNRYREALGADHVQRVRNSSSQGPLGLLELAEEVRTRLRSTGGRPTMPEWDIKRPIPFRREDWDQLTELGKELGLSPAQCAALLVETTLRKLAA